MRTLWPALVAGLASWAVAAAWGPVAFPEAAEAAARLAALDGTGGWGAYLHAVGRLGFLPFHLLLAAALWTAGVHLGGRTGAAWALATGLLAPGVVEAARGAGPGFAVAACTAWTARGIVLGRSRSAAVGAAAALVLLGVPTLVGVRGAIEAAGLVTLGGAVVALLGGGPASLAFACAGVVAGAASLGVGPLFALAGAAYRPGRIVMGIGGALAAVQLWAAPAPPDPPDVTEAAAWLGALRPARLTVDVDPPLSLPAVAWFLREAGLRVEVVPPGEDADAALVGWTVPGANAWRTLLPPAGARSISGVWELRAWDRPLPPPSLLVPGDAAAHHPARQALWALVDGEERGPLLSPASSASVSRTDTGWVVLYVREQALWRATSADGLTWDDAAPLGLRAFDPSPVRLPEGGWRLFATELSGDRTDVDPASHPTRFASWTSPDLATFTRDPGERLAGIGLVDPAPVREADGTWSLYYTAARREVRRATSTDGLAYVSDAAFAVGDATVPFAWDGWLLLQRPVLSSTALYARRGDDERALEVCGTGASVADGRLYWTRDPDDRTCAAPIVLPARRGAPWAAR